MRHAGHALAECAHEVQVGLDESRCRRRLRHARRQQLGMGLRDVIALHEGRRCQLPVHRQPARLPPLDAQRLHLPGVVDRRERLETVAQWRCVVVEVDPRAPAPELTPNRDEAKIVGVQVVLVEFFGPQDERVASVDAPTPSVKRAHESASIPVAFHQLYPAMAAGIVVGAHCVRVEPDHDDGLVEDLVLDVVARFGDLFQPACHLPHPRPEQFVFQRVELGVVVPLLGNPIGGLHRPRHRKRSPVHVMVMDISSLIGSVTPGPANSVRGCAACRACRSGPGAAPGRIRLCAGICSPPGEPGSIR